MPPLHPTDALLLVDVQNDFCPGGALPVAEGDKIIPILNRWIDAARAGGALIVASRDWHPADHVSFQERGGPWPTHCVQGSHGAALHTDLHLPPDTIVVNKGNEPGRDSYSAFGGAGLADLLQRRAIRRVFVGGLALDVCVRATVLDALKEGFEVHLIKEATRPVTVEGGRQAIAEIRAAGCIIDEDSSDA